MLRIGGFLCLLAVLCTAPVLAAPFFNLDFEQATVPAGTITTLPASLAFPGWTAWLNDTVLTTVRYNDIGAGQASVTLYDRPNVSNTGIAVLEGDYGAILTGSVSGTVSASLAQAGDVPVDTRSLRLLIDRNRPIHALTLDGNPIPLIRLSPDIVGQPTVVGGDVTAFAGSFVEVRFTGVTEIFALDAITFSSVPIPEPLPLPAVVLAVTLVRPQRRRSSR